MSGKGRPAWKKSRRMMRIMNGGCCKRGTYGIYNGQKSGSFATEY